eukprot:UN03299
MSANTTLSNSTNNNNNNNNNNNQISQQQQSQQQQQIHRRPYLTNAASRSQINSTSTNSQDSNDLEEYDDEEDEHGVGNGIQFGQSSNSMLTASNFNLMKVKEIKSFIASKPNILHQSLYYRQFLTDCALVGVNIKEQRHQTVHIHVDRSKYTLSQLFTLLHKFKQNYPQLISYSASQASLESIFADVVKEEEKLQ